MKHFTSKEAEIQKAFTLSQRVQLAVLPWILAKLFEWLYLSCKVEVRDIEHYHNALEAKGRCHVAIWHESMAIASCFNRGKDFTGLTSLSYDGEFAARVLKHWRIHSARGSSSRGGSEGLAALVEAAKTSTVTGLTMDGPRGPRRVAKPGIAVLAARTQLPIVPTAYVVDRAWHLNSWDKLPIQKPFSRIICAYAPGVAPPPNDSPEEIEKTRLAVEQRLNELYKDIEYRISSD